MLNVGTRKNVSLEFYVINMAAKPVLELTLTTWCKVKKELQPMEQLGITEKVEELLEWVSSITATKKKNNTGAMQI